MSNELELKPCPYCGGEDLLTVWKGDDIFCHIECSYCEMSGQAALEESDAIDLWNYMPRVLVWSSEPPSEPGFWWWELCGQRGVDLIQDPEKRVVRDYRAKWAGPIPEPKEANR